MDGDADIWSADLDAESGRFTNLTPSNEGADTHPAWSPDGRLLAYAASLGDLSSINVLDLDHPETAPVVLGAGSWPAWSSDGTVVAALLNDSNHSYLAAYRLDTGLLAMPVQVLPPDAQGLTRAGLSIPYTHLQPANPVNPGSISTNQNGIDPTRLKVVPLANVSAPQAYLNEAVVPFFDTLRTRLAEESGWDFFASLENAYVPLTSPLVPGMGSDWLYTGRAVAFSTAPMNAGLLAVTREDYSGQTYWRVFLKTRFQDGSQGRPLEQILWDLNARYNGDPAVYDQGGKPDPSIPDGYWLDLTGLASRFGWERVPALSNWRSLFPGSRLNEIIFSGGLNWEQAMLQLYPPEILVTPTQEASPTRTPTRAPTWFKTRTPTPAFTPSATSTPRPTWTPQPGSAAVGG